MRFAEKYKKEAITLNHPEKASGLITWRSPSNIALIKYWGKKGNQLPQNPSLSFSLDKSFTETRLEYGYKGNRRNIGNKGNKGNKGIKGDKEIRVDFTFEDQSNPAFELRIKSVLKTLSEFLPFINLFDFKIESRNSFPHSSGIASSASSMSALAFCLVTMEQKLFGTPKDEDSFLQKVSFLSRLGSGSAARSVYNDYVVWGKHTTIPGSSDEVAVRLNHEINPCFLGLKDAILITQTAGKKVSSSSGHQLMNNHPFAASRYKQAREHLTLLLHAFTTGDEQLFIRIVENEALSLHAMMMTSSDGFTLMNENTWKIIDKIRQYRMDHPALIAFTLDAGPNVHLIYSRNQEKQISQFIQQELVQYCENGNWIDDKMGDGPLKLS